MGKRSLAFYVIGVIGCGLIALFEPSFVWRLATVSLLTLQSLTALLLEYLTVSGVRAGGTEPQ